MPGSRSIGVVQKEIAELFAELAELPTDRLTSGEIAEYAVESQRIRSLADAHCVRSAGVLGRSKVWSVDGATSATAWLAWKATVQKERAISAVAAARDLRDMPLAERSMLEGRITADHVRRLAAAQRVNAEEYAADETRLVERAEELRYSQFDRLIRYW